MRSEGVSGGAAALLFAATVATVTSEPVQYRVGEDTRADTSRLWWETAVIYQIYPRSFMDTNGDGIGDLQGITNKLEYLKGLGVGAIWLSPIYPSPLADFGYDISNFIDVDPTYGSLADFKNLLGSAHKLGLKVVLDFVPNHSSDEHEWFKKSVKKEGKYTDYYVWADAKTSANGSRIPPNNWLQNFKGSAWEWNEERGQYYLHQYAVKQPDLNYRSTDLANEMKDAIRFWMKMGVDGLRVDSIITLFEDVRLLNEPVSGGETDDQEHGYLSHIYTENQPETYEMVTEWRKVLDEFGDQRIMMTEAYATLDQTVAYYGTPEKPGASFSFNFYLITSLNAASTATDFKTTIDSWMSKMDSFRKPNWVIGNHDQFRVGSFFRYGPELADGLNMISLMLPGTAMTYNGEEIGMDNTYITWQQTLDPQAIREGSKNYLLHSRDLGRTPMQWDDTTSAGFSTNKTTWLPVNSNYWHLNVKAQEEAERSHLKMYKALLKARQQPAVQSSTYTTKAVNNLLIITRALSGSPSFVVIVNLGSQEDSLRVSETGYTSLRVWTSSSNSAAKTGDLFTSSITLRAKEGLVLTDQPYGPPSPSPTTNSSAATKAFMLLSAFLPLFVHWV